MYGCKVAVAFWAARLADQAHKDGTLSRQDDTDANALVNSALKSIFAPERPRGP